MLTNLLATTYIKYFLLILISFQLLFIGMDYLGVQHKLPDSANLRLLYIVFIGGSALKVTLPIAVVFGVIAAKIHLIRKNELVAIYSLGVTRSKALLPFFAISLLTSVAYVVLQGMFFYDAKAKATGIMKGHVVQDKASNLFLKYDNNFIYIKQLYPIQKKAEGIEIYEVEGNNLLKKVSAERGYFINDAWFLYNLTIITKPRVNGLQDEGVKVEKIETQKVLSGFKPSIMDSVHEWKENLSFSDVFGILPLLVEQDISTARVRGVIYANYLVPLFAPVFVIIIFFTVPISMRFFNLALFSSLAVFITLGGWGIIFTLAQLAATGTLHPELAVLLPFVAITIFAGTMFRKHL